MDTNKLLTLETDFVHIILIAKVQSSSIAQNTFLGLFIYLLLGILNCECMCIWDVYRAHRRSYYTVIHLSKPVYMLNCGRMLIYADGFIG